MHRQPWQHLADKSPAWRMAANGTDASSFTARGRQELRIVLWKCWSCLENQRGKLCREEEGIKGTQHFTARLLSSCRWRL